MHTQTQNYMKWGNAYSLSGNVGLCFIISKSLVGTIDGVRDTNSIQAGWMKLKSDLGIIYR
jgi:hypothetical protein